MPLDVQPLSAGRRAALIIAMLLLLGGSLAFADYLTFRRAGRPLLDATFAVPSGTSWPPPVNRMEWLLAHKARNIPVGIGDEIRGLMAVRFTSDSSDDPSDWKIDLATIVQAVAGNPEDEEPIAVDAHVLLGARPAVETAVLLTDSTGQRKAWWMVRLTESGGSGVAICLSGAGALTDADKAWFDDYCRKGVTVRLVAPPKLKG